MPHVLVFAAGAASFYLALRWALRDYDRVDASLRRAERRVRKAASGRVVPLIFDESTGFYKPAE
jgi:hypothetical protein